MSARLAYSLLGRSKYHIAEGAPGGSTRHAAASLGESQRSSQAGGGFSPQSALDEGGHLSARRVGGESARRGGGESARRSGGSTHAFKALPLLSPSVSKFGGGGGGSGGATDSARAGLDHTVLKRIVEQEARLAEQAALIKRLEAKLNCALETSGHIRAEVSHMPQKICEQLTEQEERSRTLMHSLVQKLEQTLTQQLQLQPALSIRAAAADVAAGGAHPSPPPPPPPRPHQRLEMSEPCHRPSKQSLDASSSASDYQDSRPRDDAGTSPHFATRKRKLSMLGKAADEGRAEDEAEQHDDDDDDDAEDGRGELFGLPAGDDGAPPALTRTPPPRAGAAAAAAVAAAAGGGLGGEEYPSSGASSHYTPLGALGWDFIPIDRFSPSDPGLRGRLEGLIASGGGNGSSCSGGGGGPGLLGSFGGSGAVPNVFRVLAPENSERRDSAVGQFSRRRHLQALDADA